MLSCISKKGAISFSRLQAGLDSLCILKSIYFKNWILYLSFNHLSVTKKNQEEGILFHSTVKSVTSVTLQIKGDVSAHQTLSHPIQKARRVAFICLCRQGC